MNSKLLRRKSYGVKQLREGLGGQQENIEGLSEPLEATRNRNPVNLAVDAQVRFVNTAHSPAPNL
jgi:hypothetical protein